MPHRVEPADRRRRRGGIALRLLPPSHPVVGGGTARPRRRRLTRHPAWARPSAPRRFPSATGLQFRACPSPVTTPTQLRAADSRPGHPSELVTAAPRPGWVGAAGPALRALDPGLVPDLTEPADSPDPPQRQRRRPTRHSSTSSATGTRPPCRGPVGSGVTAGVQRHVPAPGLPDPRRAGERTPAGLARQRRDHAEAAGGHRGLTRFYDHENSNIHRAAHKLAAGATDAYEDARGTVRRFIGAA